MALAAFPILLAAAPLAARPIAATRVVSCGKASCLLIEGYRSMPTATVSINERRVEAAGTHKWRVQIPVQTIRDWSLPLARTLRVTLSGPGGAEQSEAVRLPVGLLGRTIELASLVVRAR